MVSIVIPVFNRRDTLIKTISSLSNQTYKNFEVLICDDGSTEPINSVVDRFSDKLNIKYIQNEHFGGPARPRNAGLKASSAEYIAFLDSDDSWGVDKLNICIGELELGFDFVFHSMKICEVAKERGSVDSLRGRNLKSPILYDLLSGGNAIATSSVVLRKKIIMRAGGFSEDRKLISWEDYEAWLRISKITQKFKYIDLNLGTYAISNDSISPKDFLRNFELLKKVDKIYSDDILGAEKRLRVRYYMRIFNAALVLGNLKEMNFYLKKIIKTGKFTHVAYTIISAYWNLIVQKTIYLND